MHQVTGLHRPPRIGSIADVPKGAGASAKTSLAIAVVCALIIALVPVADAAAKPKFNKRYKGTLSGSTTIKLDNGDVVTGEWSVSNFRLRRSKIEHGADGWTGVYKVTGGTLHFHASRTGECTFEVRDDTALLPVLPKYPASVPMAVRRNASGKWYVIGGIDVENPYKTDMTCSDGSESYVKSVEITVPTLFDPMAGKGRPGKRIRGTYRADDSSQSQSSSVVRSWDLRPR